MIKSYLPALGFILFSHDGFCQQSVSGIVLDEAVQEPLSYVNIGISNKNMGTVSAEDGTFNLKLSEAATKSDTVVFSYIGYETQKLLIRDLNATHNKVQLSPAENQLSEITIKPKKLRPKSMGRNNKGLGLMHWNFYSAHEKEVDDRLSKEVGVNMNIRSTCRLETFHVAISSNDFKSLKFRINIYDIKDSKPDLLLISDNIIFELKDRVTGWQAIDLKPYNIHLTDDLDEILVAIQWIESEKSTEFSKYLAIPASKSPLQKIYFRDKAMDTWYSRTGNLSMYVDAKCSD